MSPFVSYCALNIQIFSQDDYTYKSFGKNCNDHWLFKKWICWKVYVFFFKLYWDSYIILWTQTISWIVETLQDFIEMLEEYKLFVYMFEDYTSHIIFHFWNTRVYACTLTNLILYSFRGYILYHVAHRINRAIFSSQIMKYIFFVFLCHI